ncbi:MAG: TetR/AcrR family transcriptional regulator C-terminal domain-containing protein [Rhizobiales bacterium]|nr:TetR/AcrR family transcriptional regulator C-terminal domain-containing protein [Hyphomicrobiales bacterium]
MARAVTGTGKRAYKAPLSRDRIEEAAAEMIEAEGLEAFSIRRLAAALGYEAMSIYHYFPSKAHLFDALLDRMVASMAIAPAELPWLERLRITARSYRDAALRRPQFFKFAAIHRMNTPTGLAYLEALLAIFRDAGFDAETAARAFRALGYYVSGAGLDEAVGYAKGPSAAEPVPADVAARAYPLITAANPYFREGVRDATFDLGFEMMLEGIARMHRAMPATKRRATKP